MNALWLRTFESQIVFAPSTRKLISLPAVYEAFTSEHSLRFMSR